MRTVEESDLGAVPVETLRSVLTEYPIQVAILFGSHATGRTHSKSDIDLAVELESLRPGDPGYNDAFFGLSADLSDAFGTDDVDLVDLNACSPTLARTIFDGGILLVGDRTNAYELRERLTSKAQEKRPPDDRIDDALAEIDELLG